MANLVVTKNGEFWEAYDADRGLTVFSSPIQSVTQAFVANGVVTPAVVREYAQKSINYEGGVQASPDPSSATSAGYRTPISSDKVTVFGDSTTTTITPTSSNPQAGQVKVFGDSTTTTITPTSSNPQAGQVKVFGDSTTTTITPASSGITDQVKVYGDSTTTTITQTLPSEVTSGFYDNTPVDATQFSAAVAGNIAPQQEFFNPSIVDDQDPYAAEENALANRLSGNGVSATSIVTTPEIVDPIQDPYDAQDFQNGASQQPLAADIQNSAGQVDVQASLSPGESIVPEGQQSAQNDWQAEVARTQTGVAPGESFFMDNGNADAASVSAGTALAQQQSVLAAQRKQSNNGDWRVRLQLAPQSQYLYNDPKGPGILQPLKVSNGIIFPYTPQITTAYKANYSSYDLTHSNYRGYFYQNSFVDAVTITATFTAQSTSEANYLLAVIHFFRSVTKMFYGQDAQRGSPPPLVYLSGLGEYQFNKHACLVQSFNYTLPNEIDYIRATSPNTVGQNLTNLRDRQSVATNSNFGAWQRLAAAFLTKGALPNVKPPPSLALNNPTYVPTKLDMTIILLPVQSRQDVSQQFSLKEFANGNQLRGGFW